MNLAAWLVAMVGPMVARVLASLGLSVITLTGLTAAYSALKGYVISAIGGLPADAINLGGLFGFWHGMGVVMGGLVFCMTWKATTGFWALGKS